MRRFFLVLLFPFAAEGLTLDNITSGKVVAVIDGNTIEVLNGDNEVYRIVLAGIDCPELTQAFGESAKKFLTKVILKKEVVIRFEGKDRKGNYVAVVLLRNERDIRISLLKEGLAWTQEKDPLPELESYLEEARKKGKGLWKDNNPTPPWIYRRQQSMMRPKSR